MSDDGLWRKSEKPEPGAPLVLRVQPNKMITACGTCRHMRRSVMETQYNQCAAKGTYCNMARPPAGDCPLWERVPPRVGLLRWLWRLLW